MSLGRGVGCGGAGRGGPGGHCYSLDFLMYGAFYCTSVVVLCLVIFVNCVKFYTDVLCAVTCK